MKHEIFPSHTSLVKITKVEPFNGRTKEVTRNWEITIADKGNKYFGTAVDHSNKTRIDWVELTSMKPTEELIGICKKRF